MPAPAAHKFAVSCCFALECIALANCFCCSCCCSQAMEKATQNKQVASAMGEPITHGPWYSASIVINRVKRSVSCTFPMSGPQGDGLLKFKVVRLGGECIALANCFCCSCCCSQAMEKATQNKQVASAMGEPITRGPWYSASIVVNHAKRSVACTFPVSGPQGDGLLKFKVVRLGEKQPTIPSPPRRQTPPVPPPRPPPSSPTTVLAPSPNDKPNPKASTPPPPPPLPSDEGAAAWARRAAALSLLGLTGAVTTGFNCNASS
ncbi:hypothetical protein ZWY2020_008232 [Hordeum vulgare]|nr:hypothetical protein ZWY2020_008232 [Hordeum vulgare]